jgi:hypothetical protein
MKLKRLSILSAVFALAVLVLGCPTNVDPAPEAEIEAEQDLPGQGVMTKETAQKIFEYTELEEGSVRIDKFINAGALSAYLAGNARLAVAASDQPFRINRIGGRPVTRIAEKAFSPNAPGVPDISTVVLRIELPATIVELGINLFDGVEVKITVDIPAAAVERIKETYIEKIRVEKGAEAAEAARDNLELLQEVLGEVLAGSSVYIRRVEEPAAPGGEVKEPEVIAEGPVPPADTGEPDEPGDNEDNGEQPSTPPSGGGGSSNGNNTGGGSSGYTPPPGGGGSSGSTPSPAAVQLAADINKISAGSAAVNGATVTLSRKLSLQSQFTVPAGVTLDLTGDGELALLDAVLTVNGAVKAGPEKVRLEYAGEGTINGSGTIQLKGKGYLLVVGGNRKLTLDGVTLAGVSDNNEPLVGVGDGGAFVMKSGKITGNTHIRSDDWAGGGGVRVNEGGLFTMQGGTISGNTAQGGDNSGDGSGGGGVRVDKGGAFIMQGGAISGNTAQGTIGAAGGGVKVDGAFTMQGGAISGNITKGGANYSSGGGVEVWEGTFTMEGGAISGNTAQGDDWAGGGGVNINENSTFTMAGGTISGNTVKSDESEGGGVNVWKGAFTMADGAIYGNTIEGVQSADGGGVFIGESTFIMQGGTISENTAKGSGGSGGGGVYIEGSTFTLKGGTIYGKSDSLPPETDPSLANSAERNSALEVNGAGATAKWGTGGTYTKGGVDQAGGSGIGNTDDTLIAVPAN